MTDMLHGAGFFLLQTVIFTNTDNSEKKDWKKSGKRGTIRLMKNWLLYFGMIFMILESFNFAVDAGGFMYANY